MRFDSAFRKCKADPLKCFRPVGLSGTGTGKAFIVRNGYLHTNDGEPTYTTQAVDSYDWEVLTLEELENEYLRRETGV